MVLGSELDMLPNELVQTTVEGGRRGGSNGNFESSLVGELQLMLQEQRGRGNWGERERDLNKNNMYRSGSAPPTVEGSLTAVGSLFGKSNFSEFNSSSGGGTGSATNGVFSEEDDIRSHPAYLSYYYSHENVNPRLPPPLLSKEDWRVTQRFQEGGGSLVGGIGDWRRKNLVDDGDSSSLFSMPPRLPLQRRENEFPDPSKATPTPSSLMRQTSAEWHEKGPNCFVGLPAAGLGARRKSFADILQAGLNPPSSLAGQLSRPSSHKAVCETRNGTCFSESHLEDLCNERESMDAFHSRATGTDRFRAQGHAAGSSFSRSTTPEAQIVGGSSSTGLPPVGGRNAHNGFPSSAPKLDDVEATLSGLSLSGNNLLAEDNHIQSQLQQRFGTQTNFFFSMPSVHNQSLQQQFINKSRVEKLGLPTDFSDLAKKNGLVTEQNNSKTSLDGPANFPRRALSSDNLFSGMNSSGFGGFEGYNLQNKNIPDMDGSGHVHSGYFFNNKLSSVGRCHLDTVLSGGGDGRGSNRSKGHIGVDLHSSVMDCTQYSQRSSGYEPRATANLGNPSPAERNYFCTSQRDLVGLQNEYYVTLLAQQKHQHELLQLSRSGGMNDRYYPNISYNRDKQFQNVSPNSSDAPGGLMFQKGRSSHFTSTGRNSVEGSVGPWNPDFISNVDGRIASSLLEEFKSNKTKSFELSDIVDHLVEFSRDQFGSRFIQQKLETATTEEKNKIFPEIVPHARTLMTDVFGNYVIQKFFEHGRDCERMDLASQLSGHVLPLSLQMYGCRVIQKALEVVDVDQQTLMVSELDGSVMKCVRDQNGNHVIQKSIECVPQDRIQFIISAFYGQVVSLSTHPYGCRVIQRVLEHCCDLNAQQIIMDEIMQSVCNLAQDQYGNYVIQHILQHGKADERTAIISKLAGQIVKMSQQKFASNVVEKCLTFGGPEERQLLVTEMLGYSDDNEPLQAMMKDPFGNYVVQKVLETYNDQSRELILSRIKVHLNTLKKYTYGKHIVSRVEKLITTGERHMAMSSSFSS